MNRLEKRLHRRQEMFELITSQQNSGLSQVEFCRQQKMSIATFSYWRKKYLIEKEHQEQHLIIASTDSKKNLKKQRFVPLKIQSDIAPLSVDNTLETALEIQLSNQIILRYSSWRFNQLSDIVDIAEQLQQVKTQ